jgi:uncharacterized paraquat-inducible protein A
LGNNNIQLIRRLKNIGLAIIWLITSIVLSEIFQLHISMGISIAIFVLILWYMRTSAKKQNMELAKTDIDNGSSNRRKKKDNDKISYYCMSCWTKHNEENCPTCGSRMKKASFLWYGLIAYATGYYFF